MTKGDLREEWKSIRTRDQEHLRLKSIPDAK